MMQLFSKRGFFILCVMLLGFFISCEYGITRPALNSIFIASYSARFIPYSWIATIPLNFLVISLYNRFLPRAGCKKTFLFIVLSIIIVNTLGGFLSTKVFFFPFFQDLCKSIYILLMFKHLWSMIHTTFSKKEAKYLYGIIFGMGGIGSVLGGTLAHFLAVPLGSQTLFFFTLPIYILIYLVYLGALKSGGKELQAKDFLVGSIEGKGETSGFALIKGSRMLLFVLFLVIFMQATTTFIDYQFNIAVEAHFHDIDLRTQYLGKVVSIINSITSLFQFLGGLVLIHLLGLRKVHFLVPFYLLSNTLTYWLFPTFGMVSYSYISIKALDYSVFGIARELLYLPMKTDEKFRAKAIIDVFAYRSARGGASFLILLLQALTPSISNVLNFLTVSIFIIWLFLVFQVRKETSFTFEMETSN